MKLCKLLSMLVIFILTLSVAGIPTQTAQAFATLNVDNSDLTACSDVTGDPYCTIQAAINQASADDIVHVAAGIYHEQIIISKPLTVTGEDGAVLDGTGLLPQWTTGVKIRSGNVTFNNIDVTNFTQDGITAYKNIDMPNLHITNSKISNIQPGYWGFGIYVGFESEGFEYSPPKLTGHLNFSGLLIEGNEITNVHSSALVIQSLTGTSGTLQVKNNYIHDNTTNSGIWIDCARNLLIENNTVVNNKWGIEFTAIPEFDYPSFLNGPYSPKDVILRGNTVSNNTEQGIVLYQAWPSTITITGNSIEGNATGIDNQVADMLNASANWWGDLDPSDNIIGAGSVDYTPWLNVATDTSGDPGFQGDFSYLNVDDNSPQTGSAGRIQEAIDETGANGTVLVKSGTYVEQVVVNKSLTLFGEFGADTTIIKAPATIPVASNANSNIVTIAGSGVVADLSGFKVTGPGPTGCGSIGNGIFVRDGAYASIHNNKILDIRDSTFSGCQNGVAILVGRESLGTTGSADIKDNLISGYQKNGITVSNTGSSATVTNNVITGAGATTTIAQNGIQFSAGATGAINGNTISNHSYSPGTWTSTGVLLWGADVDTYGNTLSENQVGVYHIEGSGLHEANLLNVSTAGTQSPYFYGLIVDAPPPGLNPAPFEDELAAVAAPISAFAVFSTPVQDVDILNNELASDGTSAGYGIGGYAGFGTLDIDLTVKNNKITNFGTGVDIYQCIGAGCTSNVFSNLDVNFNSITSSVDHGLLNIDAISTDAENNWWGSNVATNVAAEVSGDVDYTPWLCSGVDTSADPGFQPSLLTNCSEFSGFFQPIDMNATNTAKAGQTIPVKWRLTDASGAPISDPGMFAGLISYNVSCSATPGLPDAIETYSGSSGLQYLGDGYWQFNWKTPKSYANTCRAIYIQFTGGLQSLEVDFKFK